MVIGDLLIMLCLFSFLLIVALAIVKMNEFRNKSKQNWHELDDKIEEIKKTLAEEMD